MSVYVVANFDITDRDLYQQYRSRVSDTISKHGGRLLAVDSEPLDLDGNSRSACVIAEFDSAEVVERWYQSPEYQSILPLRVQSTEGWLRLVPQIT